jgi:hypothetical protein
MKKVLFFAIAIVTFSFANAQEVSYGLKAGLNYSNWSFSDSDFDGYDSRLSFHFGGVVELGLSDKFSVQPEILYSSVGAQMDLSDAATRVASDDKFVYALDYLSIPVMAKYYVAEGFSLEVGPQIGVLLSAKAKYDGESEDIKDSFKSTDFSAGIGAGYKMENGLFINARYVLGLSNVLEDSGDEWGKNNAFQFSLGYKFN